MVDGATARNAAISASRRADEDPVRGGRIVREEFAKEQEGRTSPEPHERRAERRARDQLVAAVAIEVHSADDDAAWKRGVVGEEAAELGKRRAVPDADVRSAARSGASDNLGSPIAVDVSGGYVDAARKGWVVGEEATKFRQSGAAPHADVRSTAWTGRR